jgi:hypothetical protein
VEESDEPCEVMLSPEKARCLGREGMEPVGERPERGEISREVGVEEVKDGFGLEQIREAVFT